MAKPFSLWEVYRKRALQRARGKRYRERHPDRIAKKNRNYWLGNKEAMLEYNRNRARDEYIERKSENLPSKYKEYYSEHKEQLQKYNRKYMSEYRKTHREKTRENYALRVAGLPRAKRGRPRKEPSVTS